MGRGPSDCVPDPARCEDPRAHVVGDAGTALVSDVTSAGLAIARETGVRPTT